MTKFVLGILALVSCAYGCSASVIKNDGPQESKYSPVVISALKEVQEAIKRRNSSSLECKLSSRSTTSNELLDFIAVARVQDIDSATFYPGGEAILYIFNTSKEQYSLDVYIEKSHCTLFSAHFLLD